jgi:hypothetical protein
VVIREEQSKLLNKGASMPDKYLVWLLARPVFGLPEDEWRMDEFGVIIQFRNTAIVIQLLAGKSTIAFRSALAEVMISQTFDRSAGGQTPKWAAFSATSYPN